MVRSERAALASRTIPKKKPHESSAWFETVRRETGKE